MQIEVPARAFVLLPCDSATERPCALAIAGGKRIAVGAPAGAAFGRSQEDLRLLDGVMLMSLRAQDVEGLDELRNASWQAGRRQPLLVAGPSGTEDFVQRVNAAFETADALRMIDDVPPEGGFDAALIVPMELSGSPGWETVFDTGDFSVDGAEAPDGYVEWRLTYDVEVRLMPCGGKPVDEDMRTALTVRCDGSEGSWPLTAPVWISGRSN